MRVTLLLSALLVALPLAAQSPRHTAYAEIGGNGIALTVNYEYRFAPQLAARIGFSHVSTESDSSADSSTAFLFPVMLNYITRPERSHHLELGGGLLLSAGESIDTDIFSDDEQEENFSSVVGTATIGYRYQRPGRGFVFRAGLTPLFDTSTIAP